MSSVLVSGGAVGADSYWAQTAIQNNHLVVHMSFKGHKTSQKCVRLSPQLLSEAGTKLKPISKLLNRVIPANSYVRKLIQRNYCIALVGSIYVIDTKFNGTTIKSLGGSAWAAATYWYNGGRELYVWNDEWYQITGINKAVKCIPARPSGRYAGIGQRDITPAGQKAIRELYTSVNNLK